MGNDGGTIAKPIDLLNLYKQDDKVDSARDSVVDNIQDRLTICKWTNKPLQHELIMSDYKGSLFVKQNILHGLLNKNVDLTKQFSHIRTINDLVDVKATFSDGQLICPITKSSQSFCYLRPCGCILDKGLIDKLNTVKVGNCPNCDQGFDKYDIVLLNPLNDKDIANKNEASLNKLHELGLHHNKKKQKVKKRKPSKESNDDVESQKYSKKRSVEPKKKKKNQDASELGTQVNKSE